MDTGTGFAVVRDAVVTQVFDIWVELKFKGGALDGKRANMHTGKNTTLRVGDQVKVRHNIDTRPIVSRVAYSDRFDTSGVHLAPK